MKKEKPVRLESPPCGIYRLSRTIDNPAGDQRVRHQFWRRPCWPVGQKFVIGPFDDGLAASPDVVVLHAVGSNDCLAFIEPNKARLDLIVPYLEPIALDCLENVLLALNVAGITPARVVHELHARGLLTLDTLLELLK